MKKISICLSLLVLLLAGCYSDKGGNDYDTTLPDVQIVIPEEAYSASLGSTITITPEVKTDIPESDLEYFWEVEGEVRNSFGRSQYSSLVPSDQQAKVLNYTCHLDSNVVSLNTSYNCRLRVHQKSTGRNFYSENTCTITIAGVTGLMVLYGDDSQSDVGILQASEFMPKANSIPDTPNAISGMYATANGGQKITGKGESIVYSVSDYNASRYAANTRVVVHTDKGWSFLRYSDLEYLGDWSSMFFLHGDEALNQNKPKGYCIDGSNYLAFDGNAVFKSTPSSPLFLDALIDNTMTLGDGNKLVLEPWLARVSTSGQQVVSWCSEVNGKSQNGFVSIGSYGTNYFKLLDTGDDKVDFNPGDMKADLLQMKADDRGHAIAALKGHSDNTQYAGKFFMVDLNPNASAEGNSGMKGVPQHIYDLSGQPDINNAFAFDFGNTINMCYYATPTGVYAFGHDAESNSLYNATKLSMANGEALDISGEVTMMKLLDSPNVETHNTEPILMVATWDGTSSTLYALHIDKTSGKVKTVAKYNKDNVSGWNFGKIRDANIKNL